MKIFIIGGSALSGKNTFGNCMREELKKYGYKPCVMRLTEPLYAYARNYFEWNEHSTEKPREFLQRMGVEIIKEKLHKNYFLIDRTCEDIEILSTFFDVFIITDGRLIMEFEEFKKRYSDVTAIKIEREGFDNGLSESEKNHITEREILDYDEFDYIVKNKDFDDLAYAAAEIVADLEGNVDE